MYAIIVTGGKQYRVEQGDIVYIEKLDVEADSEVKFDQVLAIGEEGSVKVGAPVVEGASVSAKVIKNGKGKKLNIITYRAKKHSARRMGILSVLRHFQHRDDRADPGHAQGVRPR